MRERYFVAIRCKLDELFLRTLEILSLSGMTSFNFILRPQKSEIIQYDFARSIAAVQVFFGDLLYSQ